MPTSDDKYTLAYLVIMAILFFLIGSCYMFGWTQ